MDFTNLEVKDRPEAVITPPPEDDLDLLHLKQKRRKAKRVKQINQDVDPEWVIDDSAGVIDTERMPQPHTRRRRVAHTELSNRAEILHFRRSAGGGNADPVGFVARRRNSR